MKRFAIKIILFVLVSLTANHIRPFVLLYKDRYKKKVAGNEIYFSIFKSKQKNDKKNDLLLGDSVGKQLFPNTINNDTINSLACNQAIGLPGQYFLLNNYLRAGNKVDTVFFVATPFSFLNNLDQEFTYHYFLKPFYTEEYTPLFTETVKKQVEKIPFKGVCRYAYVLTSNWAPKFSPADTVNFTFLSPISIEYLQKINDLEEQYGFSFVILPTPVSIEKKAAVEQINIGEITQNNLAKQFEHYFENIVYLDDSNFIDGIHLKTPEIYTGYYSEFFGR